MAKIVYRQIPTPRELPQQIPAPRAKPRMQKSQGGGKLQIIGGARGGDGYGKNWQLHNQALSLDKILYERLWYRYIIKVSLTQ